ncbi:MAG: cupin domain-containing protein [Neisseria sp.]|nr:cupin domain-containing protein [Neisseria sp.]
MKLYALALAAAIVSPLVLAHGDNAQNSGGRGETITPVAQTSLVAPINSTTATALRVDYAPGGYSGAHRHPQYVFVVVVDGEIETAVNDEAPKRYKAGEGWYEAPNDLHRISRNASQTKPATLVAWLLSDGQQPLVAPEK